MAFRIKGIRAMPHFVEASGSMSFEIPGSRQLEFAAAMRRLLGMGTPEIFNSIPFDQLYISGTDLPNARETARSRVESAIRETYDSGRVPRPVATFSVNLEVHVIVYVPISGGGHEVYIIIIPTVANGSGGTMPYNGGTVTVDLVNQTSPPSPYSKEAYMVLAIDLEPA